MTPHEEGEFMKIFDRNKRLFNRNVALKKKLKNTERRYEKLRLWAKEKIKLCNLLRDVWSKG